MKIGTIALTALTSLAGSIAGNGARMLAQEWMRRERLAAAGEEPESGQIVITGVITNMVAATTIASMLPKNNAMYGFAIGMALSVATGDSVDRWVGEMIAGATVATEPAARPSPMPKSFVDESDIYDD